MKFNLRIKGSIYLVYATIATFEVFLSFPKDTNNIYGSFARADTPQRQLTLLYTREKKRERTRNVKKPDADKFTPSLSFFHIHFYVYVWQQVYKFEKKK